MSSSLLHFSSHPLLVPSSRPHPRHPAGRRQPRVRLHQRQPHQPRGHRLVVVVDSDAPGRASSRHLVGGMYRVTLVVEYLGWVDLDLGCSTILLGQ